MPVELPISPQLNEGRIDALFPFIGDAAKPVPLTATSGPPWYTNVDARTQASTVYAKLGVAAVFNAETSLTSRTAAWDCQVGKISHLDCPGHDDVIYQTLWACGIRISVTFQLTEVKADASIAIVAASAEANAARVQYHIESIGLGPTEFATTLRDLPPIGKFDMITYAKIVRMRNTLRNALIRRLDAMDAEELGTTLQPTVIWMDRFPMSSELDDASAYRFSMQCIEAGLTREETLGRVKKLVGGSWNEKRVGEIFDTEVASQRKPTQSERNNAREWLNTSQ